jgi:uncharacterized membrane protein
MYQLAAYIHLLAAITWLGGTLFLGLVLLPVTRGIQNPPSAGSRVLGSAARRFRIVAWGALITLVLTGIWLLLERGVGPSELITGRGWFFQTLRIKVGLVALVLTLSAIHDFVLGPRLARGLEVLRGAATDSTSILRRRRVVSWLARFNLALALAIVALGVVLVRGVTF